jgi:hypothetical protein
MAWIIAVTDCEYILEQAQQDTDQLFLGLKMGFLTS